MQPFLIDTHAHLYLPVFAGQRDALVERAQAAGVGMILLPAIDSESHVDLVQLEDEVPMCRGMMGLHPCSVKEDWEAELAEVEAWLNKRRFVAVGEIGLDFYWDKTFVEQQYLAFHRQIELALQHRLPISIHSRNATDECIDVVAQYPNLRGVFHCFSGNLEQAQRLVAMGWYLGVGGVVTFKNGGLDKVLPLVGLSSLVLETDAPYLAPVPHRGKRNEPAYTALVAERVAQLVGEPLETVAAATTANAEKLFAINRIA